jgi:N-acyl-L-homoserine lactone synthetase
MHVMAIRYPQTVEEIRILDDVHRLRARIFQGRLAWKVHCVNGREYDEFDDLSPTHIIALSKSMEVIGGARLLPAIGPTMLGTVFPQLLCGQCLHEHEAMVESSRFCIDTSVQDRSGQVLHEATLAMFAGIIEWCIVNGYSEIVTATDIRFERILRRAGWPLERLGEPTWIGETRSIAGRLDADWASFRRVRPDGYTSSFAEQDARSGAARRMKPLLDDRPIQPAGRRIGATPAGERL